MNKFVEFSKATIIQDPLNPFCTLFEYPDGTRFYIEPIFYTYLQNLKIQHADRFDDVLLEMERIVHLHKKVIFTGMDEEYEEEPVTKAEGYIIRTLFDITNSLQIFIEDKSRGSDYGD